MKINRLVELVIHLLHSDSTTAKELADQFGVSTRTIYRDIDVLSSSGIPIYMKNGYGGGISIMEHFSLPKALLTQEEKENLLFALQAFQATEYPSAGQALSKLSALFRGESKDWIAIDFAAWSTKSNGLLKFIEIRNAILNGRCVRFSYINARNERSRRTIEPVQLQYKARDWYLYGWDLDKTAHRLFKVTRIKNFSMIERQPQRQREKAETASPPATSTRYEFLFSNAVLYRLYDYYEEEEIHQNADGSYTVATEYPESPWLYEHLLSFGPHVKVLSPPHVRERHRCLVESMGNLYSGCDR